MLEEVDSLSDDEDNDTRCFMPWNLDRKIQKENPNTIVLKSVCSKDFFYFALGIMPSFNPYDEGAICYLLEQMTQGEIPDNFKDLSIPSSIELQKIQKWLSNQNAINTQLAVAYLLNFLFLASEENGKALLALTKEIFIEHEELPSYLKTLYKWFNSSFSISSLRHTIEICALKQWLNTKSSSSVSCFFIKNKGYLIQWAWNANIIIQIPFDIHTIFKELSDFSPNANLENPLIFELTAHFFSLGQIEALSVARLLDLQMTPSNLYEYVQKFLNSKEITLHLFALHLLLCCKIDVSTKRALFLIFSPGLILNLPEDAKKEFLNPLKKLTADSDIEKEDLISSHKVLKSLAFNNKYCLLNEVLTTILNYKIWKFDEITFNYFGQYLDLLFLYPNQDLPTGLLYTIAKYIVLFPSEFFAKQPFSQTIKNTFHFLIMHLRNFDKEMAMKLLFLSEKIFHDSAPKKEWVANLFFEFITPYLNSSSFDAWSLLKKLSCEPLISYLAPIQKKQIEGYFSSTADLKKIQEFTILLNKGAFFDAKLKITNFLINHPQFPSNQATALLFDLLCQKNLKEKKYDREIALLWITWGIKEVEYYQQEDQKKVFIKLFIELSSSILTQKQDIDEILKNIFNIPFSIDLESLECTQFASLLVNFNLSIPNNENSSQFFKTVLEKICKTDWNLTKNFYVYCKKRSLIKFFPIEFITSLINLASEQSDTQALMKFLDHPQLSDTFRYLTTYKFLKDKGSDPIVFELWLGYMDFFPINKDDQIIFQKNLVQLNSPIKNNLQYKVGRFFNRFIESQIEKTENYLDLLDKVISLDLKFLDPTLNFFLKNY